MVVALLFRTLACTMFGFGLVGFPKVLLKDLLYNFAGREKLNYPPDKAVYVVLEEDGTEVDEEEYFQTLPENTLLILLYVGEKWSPFGPPFT